MPGSDVGSVIWKVLFYFCYLYQFFPDCKKVKNSKRIKLIPIIPSTWLKRLTFISFQNFPVHVCIAIGRDPDAGEGWGQEEKGTTEDEMVGWHHRLNGHGIKPALGDGEGQGGLVCSSPWGHRESDRTEWLNTSAEKYILQKQGTWCHSVIYDYFTLFIDFWPYLTARWIIVPQPRIEFMPPAVGDGLNHCPSREVPIISI